MGQKSHGKGGCHHIRIRVMEATAKTKKAQCFLVWHENVSSAYFKADLGDQGSENCGGEILDEAERGRLETSVLPQAPSHMIRDENWCENNWLVIKQLTQVCVHCMLAPSAVIWVTKLPFSIWFRLTTLTDLTGLERQPGSRNWRSLPTMQGSERQSEAWHAASVSSDLCFSPLFSRLRCFHRHLA